MKKYEIKLEEFSGPLDKLLELIEAKEMEITTLSLADVTIDFLNYAKSLGESVTPVFLSDFLVVAAKLVFIKSKSLIPEIELSSEEEAEMVDLEERLKLYKEFSARSGGASIYLSKLWDSKARSYSRKLFTGLNSQGFFYPSENLSQESLAQTAQKLMRDLQRFAPEEIKVKNTIIKIEDKIKELLERWHDILHDTFSNLSQSKPKPEVVALFLAVLHLLKAKEISVEQNQGFGDIILKKKQML